MQSEKLKEVQPQLEKLEKKYKDKTSEEDQKRKAEEMMAIYSKIKLIHYQVVYYHSFKYHYCLLS